MNTYIDPLNLSRLPTSKFIMKQRIKRQTKIEWKRVWDTGTTGRFRYRLHKRFPTKTQLRHMQSLSRSHYSIIMQLRTNHVSLRHFLPRFGFLDSNKCCCGLKEDVYHYILDCRKIHRNQNKSLRLHTANTTTITKIPSFWYHRNDISVLVLVTNTAAHEFRMSTGVAMEGQDKPCITTMRSNKTE